MKELSIEEKAKAYDEVRKKIAIRFGSNVADEIFSEYEESEDERIRKALIDWFSDTHAADDFGGIAWERIVDWLEKQGDTFTKKDVDDAYLKGICDAKHELEKQGEQKPTDKVEPKFHEGDWVVQENIGVYKVIEVCESWYEVVDNKDKHYSIGFDKEYMCHLYTIQDAKDGDVLAIEPIEGYHSPFVAIYKKQNKEDFDSYCFIGFDGKFYKGECHSTEKVHPATKEQHDTLEKAMADAGYVWDAEKKQVIDYLDSLPKDNWEFIHEFVEKFGRIPKDEDELNVLIDYVMKRQKLAWSEEDERMYRGLHNLIYSTPYCDSRKELSDWLKLLKERVQPQPKQEWSEEDDKKINYLIILLQNSTLHNSALRIANEGIENWLKSLRPQNTWKPSSELDEASYQVGIKRVLENPESYGLTKYNWKPSDEQMEVLEALVEDNNQRYFYTTLNSLYEHLKKLREE